MRKLVLSAVALFAVLTAGGISAAHARDVSFGISIGVPFPAPVYVAPAPVYYSAPAYYPPPPVYYAPRAVYAPPVYYAPRPVYVERGHWRDHRGHHGHRGQGHGHRGHWR